MTTWQVLPTLSAPMSFQMALDELLLESQKQKPCLPQLRFYFSSKPWISVGCSFRSQEKRGDSSLIENNPKLPVCERVTGGGCVLHGQDLIFSLIIKMAPHGERLGSVQTSYGVIHQSVKMAFEKLGFDLASYGVEEDLAKGSDCFDFPVARDLAWQGKKIAGGAQKRSEGVLLHQESIQLMRGVQADGLIREIGNAMEQVFDVKLEPGMWDPSFLYNAQKKAAILAKT